MEDLLGRILFFTAAAAAAAAVGVGGAVGI